MIIIIFDLTSNPIRPDSNPSEKKNILVYTSKEKNLDKLCLFCPENAEYYGSAWPEINWMGSFRFRFSRVNYYYI